MTRLTFGSLFTGGIREHGGGFDIGFMQAGLTPKWELEITRGKDITKERPEDYEAVDLICGGPPCKHTSLASQWSGTRTHESLWTEMLRFVEQKKPNWVVVEQPASTERFWVQGVVQDLQRNCYGVAGRIIDSKHWLPQQRARWFIIGRLGVNGLDLGDHLYNVCNRPQKNKGKKQNLPQTAAWMRGKFRSCSDCLPSGIFARVSKSKPALIAAGNAVSVPVARWLGEQILRVEGI